MKYVNLCIECKMTTAGLFSEYKGSMLRGVMGTYLRKSICGVRHGECNSCILSSTCIFPKLFLFTKTICSDINNSPELPPVYVIEPICNKETHMLPEDVFSFNLVLFSYATEYIPYFVYAFSLAGEAGMGKVTPEERGTFVVTSVSYKNINIYDTQHHKLMPIIPDEIELPILDDGEARQVVDVYFETPCRFKQSNVLSSDISFSQLILLVLRRLRGLWAIDAQSGKIAEFDRVMALAAEVKTETSAVSWRDWTRYSGRQNTTMQLGGLQGHIRYTGPVHAFAHFLEAARLLHIGKQTSFGLGKIQYQYT